MCFVNGCHCCVVLILGSSVVVGVGLTMLLSMSHLVNGCVLILNGTSGGIGLLLLMEVKQMALLR